MVGESNFGYSEGMEESLSNPEQKEEVGKPIDSLIVFGGGVVTDASLKKRDIGENIIGKETSGWRIPLVAKVRVRAAAELYLNGQVSEVILTGGPVGKGAGLSLSEAELMRDYFLNLLKNRVNTKLKSSLDDPIEIEAKLNDYLNNAEQHIILEDKATNTIENFAHTINYLDENPEQHQNIGLLSNDFHVDRIVKLADKFGVEGIGLGSDTIIENSKEDPRIKRVVERYLSVDANKQYIEDVLADATPEEQATVKARLGNPIENAYKEEKRWSRALDEIPEYWLPNIKFLNNPHRLKNILQSNDYTKVLQEAGLDDADKATIDELKNALSNIKRIMPPEEWAK